ncbi:MAG: hypothetical protein AAB955_01650 [Patescibacteria group bacterium]
MKHTMSYTRYNRVHKVGTALAVTGILVIGAALATYSITDGAVGALLTLVGFGTRMYATASLCDMYRDDPFAGYQI